jgi:hypothetical protein
VAARLVAVRRDDRRRALSSSVWQSVPRRQTRTTRKDWWGTVTGFQPPGSLDFHHTIQVRQLKAIVETHIHYSFEPQDGGTVVTRWLVLDITMPILFRPLRPLIIKGFDEENVRTMAAVKQYAEAHPDGDPDTLPAS